MPILSKPAQSNAEEKCYKDLYDEMPSYNVAKPLIPFIYECPKSILEFLISHLYGFDAGIIYINDIQLYKYEVKDETPTDFWYSEDEEEKTFWFFDYYRGWINCGKTMPTTYSASTHKRLPKNKPFKNLGGKVLQETLKIIELGEKYEKMSESDKSSYRSLFTRRVLTKEEKEAKKEKAKQAKIEREQNMTPEEKKKIADEKAEKIKKSKEKNYWKKKLNDTTTMKCNICDAFIKVNDGDAKYNAHFETQKHEICASKLSKKKLEEKLGVLKNLRAKHQTKLDKKKEKIQKLLDEGVGHQQIIKDEKLPKNFFAMPVVIPKEDKDFMKGIGMMIDNPLFNPSKEDLKKYAEMKKKYNV